MWEMLRFMHCSEKGPHFKDQVPIGTFDFLGPYLFSVFWLKSVEKVLCSVKRAHIPIPTKFKNLVSDQNQVS